MIIYLYGLSILLYLVKTIFPKVQIDFLLSSICLVIVLTSFFYVKRFVKVLGLIFLSLGVIMLISAGAGWKHYVLSFGPMLNLLTLFTLIPILALPIRLGEYATGIQGLVEKRVKNTGHLYMMTSGISYFFSIFMNLATLPMTYYSMRPALDIFTLQNRERFMSRAITHGFAMPLLWAPVTPIVGIVIEMTGVSWGSVLPYVIPLSIFGLALDWFLGLRVSSKRENQGLVEGKTAEELAITEEKVGKKGSARRILQIFVAILIFNVIISILEQVFHFSFIVLVALTVIPFALIWSLFLKKTSAFFSGLKEHFQTHLLKMRAQFVIFLSAGFFISTIQVSGMDHLLNGWIGTFKGVIGSEIFLVLIPVIPLLLAFTGLHPAVALALMAGSLDPNILDISPHILTVSMLGGAVSAFLMGPYNATIGLMSSIVNESPFKISNWNIQFTVIYLVVLMMYLVTLQIVI
ncbi:hypothetical protein LC040_08480 [Bacillus tianshenii]|nr:hypothetical protein LC040_08480 [Bacillus tianshenii]